MAKIVIELDKCSDGCPFCTSERTPNLVDSWEHAVDIFCEAADHRKIAGYVEWPSEMPYVPNWCPLRMKEGREQDEPEV